MLLFLLGSVVECSIQTVETMKPYFMSPTGNQNMGLSLGNNGVAMLGSNKLPVAFGTKLKNDEPDTMYVDGRPMCMNNNTLSVCQPGDSGVPLRPKWKNNGIRIKYVSGTGLFGKSEKCLALQQNGSLSFESCGDRSTNQEWAFSPAPLNSNNGQNNGPNGGQGGNQNGQYGGSGNSYGWSNNNMGSQNGNNGYNNCNNSQGYSMTGQGAQQSCYPFGASYDQSNCSSMLMAGQQGCNSSQGYSMNGSNQAAQECIPFSQPNSTQGNSQGCTPSNAYPMYGASQSSQSYSAQGSAGSQGCTPSAYSTYGTGQSSQGCTPSLYPNLSQMNTAGGCVNAMGC